MSSSHKVLKAIAPLPLSEEKKLILCKPKNADFWIKLAETPRSYELFDTPEEEKLARRHAEESKSEKERKELKREEKSDSFSYFFIRLSWVRWQRGIAPARCR